MAEITEFDRKVVLAFAENNMNLTETGKALFIHRNSVDYHLKKVKRLSGLNPFSFYDLVKLVGQEDTDVH